MITVTLPSLQPAHPLRQFVNAAFEHSNVFERRLQSGSIAATGTLKTLAIVAIHRDRVLGHEGALTLKDTSASTGQPHGLRSALKHLSAAVGSAGGASCPSAFTQAVKLYRPLLVRYATSLVGQDGEDIVQITLERVMRSRPNGAVLDWRAWLMTATRNTSLNWIRDHKREEGRAGGGLASLEALRAPESHGEAAQGGAWGLLALRPWPP